MSIGNSLVNHLAGDSTLVSALGSNKIFWRRVPNTIEMPWVVMSIPAPGKRIRITQYYTEIEDVVDIEVENKSMTTSESIAMLVLRRLENFRGDLLDIYDVLIECSSIRTLDGAFGTYRSMFKAHVRYKEVTQFPS